MIHIKVQEEPQIRINANATVTVSDGGYERGYEAGYSAGYSEGETVGYARGEAHGLEVGYAQGKADGHAEGYAEGYAKGYADGYAAGYDAGYEAGKIPIVEKDVNFYNYDGRLLHSYTLEEVQALTELPPAPPMGRDFLTFEEWNWSLEDIKALHLPLSVMATVCPTDGNTKAVLEIRNEKMRTITMRLLQLGGVMTVDWGDGSAPTVFEAANSVKRTAEHTYASVGTYIVTLSAGERLALGHYTTTTSFIYGRNPALTEIYFAGNAAIGTYGLLSYKCLEIVTFAHGRGVIGDSALWQSTRIKAVSLPRTITSIGNQAFNQLYCLSVLSLPAAVETIGYASVTSTNALRSITIPPKCSAAGSRWTNVPNIYLAEGVTNIDGEFAYDGVLRSIVIPSTVETIGSQAFRGCASMEKMVFKPLVPPTVANSNAFGIGASCIVEVPAESLEAYRNATNYGAIAAQMVGV